MKNGISNSAHQELEVLERSYLQRKNSLEALGKCKEKEHKLKHSNKIQIVMVKIDYGYKVIYKRIKNKK